MYPMLVYNVAGGESLSGHKLAGRFPAGRQVTHTQITHDPHGSLRSAGNGGLLNLPSQHRGDGMNATNGRARGRRDRGRPRWSAPARASVVAAGVATIAMVGAASGGGKAGSAGHRRH